VTIEIQRLEVHRQELLLPAGKASIQRNLEAFKIGGQKYLTCDTMTPTGYSGAKRRRAPTVGSGNQVLTNRMINAWWVVPEKSKLL
jgi:hypothetical protein